MNSSQKLLKLKELLNDLNKKTFTTENQIIASWSETPTEIRPVRASLPSVPLSLSQDFSLYLSLIEKPINLLFSLDQFVFEFSKKTYQQKKTGEFFQQLKERKKLSMFYGDLTRKQLVNVFYKVQKNKGYFAKNFLSLLERRLDVVIYRSGLTKTIAEARQLIKHQKILVNHKILNVPSAVLNPGDVIEITQKKKPEISNVLVNEFYTKTRKPCSQSLGDFVNTNSFKFVNKSISTNYSKLFCNLFIQEICTRIKLRAYWDFNRNFFLTTPTVFSSKTSQFEVSIPKIETSILTMFKWKAFSKKKNVSLTSQTLKKQNQFFSNYATGGCLQKHPFIWNQNLSKIKTIFFYKKLKSATDISTSQSDKKHFKSLHLTKLKRVKFKKNFLFFLKHLENSKKFLNLMLLVNKFLLRKSNFKLAISKKLNFRVIRPMHIEISYNTLSMIYLYSPQRINFPFAINLDLISRSLG